MSQVPVEVLSRQDVERLIAHPDRGDIFGLRDAAILATLYYAAATASEVANLDLRDLDIAAREVRFQAEEGRLRKAPLEPELVEILECYLGEARRLLMAQGGLTDDSEMPAVFITNRGHRIHVQDIRQILGAHSKAVGIEKAVNYNTLRLSRAWHLREDGESPEVIQRLLGTSSRSGRRVV